MKEIKTGTKSFLPIIVFIVLAAVSGCTLFSEPSKGRGSLMIALGIAPPGQAKVTYTPEFTLSIYEKVVIDITNEDTGAVVPEIVRYPRTDSSVIELLDLPYGRYSISARAYINSSDDEEDYAAVSDTEFEFSAYSYWATIMLDPLMGDEGTTGTLRYKLINAIGFPVSAVLYPFDEADDPDAKITLTQGLNPLDTQSGYHSLVLDSGYYLFFFGEYAPSVVHIYKDLVTVLDAEYSIYGTLSKIPYPQGDSDVQIIVSSDGIALGDNVPVSYGTDVKITIIGGNNYRYITDSVKLNGGDDDNWFITPEVENADGSYSRTFRMPGRDVAISVDSELIPKGGFDFNDPNMYRYLQFRRVSDNAVIDSVYPGEKITVEFNNPAEPAPPFAVLSWWLDLSPQNNSDGAVFTVPDPCSAWNVTVMVTIGNMPYSVSIPVRQE